MEVLNSILLALLIFLYFLLQKSNPKKPHPPGPSPLPVIGNLHQLLLNSSAPHHYLYQLSKKYGPLMSLRLGFVPTLVVSSAKMAEEVLKNHDLEFASRPPLRGLQKLSYNGYDMAFAPYGEYWREMRKICMIHLFSRKRVQSFRGAREDEVSRMIERLSGSELVNLSQATTSLNGAIICRTAFGKSFGELPKVDDDGGGGQDGQGGETGLKELMHETQAMFVAFFFSDYFPLMGWVDKFTGVKGRLEKNFQELDMFYQEIIDEHMDAHNKGPKPGHLEDFTDVMLRLKGDGQLNFDQIKAIFMNVLVAATETSAAAIVWTMTELMKNPRVMRVAQDEVRNSIRKEGRKDKIVNEDEVQKLSYLRAIVKETLRLHPVAPLLIAHENIQKCNIEGYNIEPKTLVYVNAWAIGRDPVHWERAEEFWPERFMGNEATLEFKLGQDYGLIPFGAGRRGCPGMLMGLVTLELALANLLYNFDWALPDGMKVEDIDNEVLPGITMHKKTPLCLVPKIYQC